MKQTAMQEHIEWLKATIEIAEEQSPILVNALKLCLNDATQRLEMEKEQIKDAWNDGYDKGTRDRIEKISNPVGNAEQYYNNTFKSE